MKVLVISHMYPSSYSSIAGIFIKKQVTALKKSGCDIRVVSPVPYAPAILGMLKKKWKSYREIPLKTMVDGIEVYYPRYLDFPKSFFMEYSGYLMYKGIGKTIENIYRDFKFDLIHAHVALPDGICGSILKKKYNVPLVITIHGQDLQVTVNKNKRCKRNVYKAMVKSDKLVVVSNKLKNLIEDNELKNRTYVIHNGVDIENNFEAIPCNNGIKTIISVSNLYKFKGIDLNLYAFSMLYKKYPDTRYIIIGDGPERDNLVKLSERLRIADRVKFLGRLPHDEAMCYMKSSDIFCLPSYNEGFGVVYLEAMSVGKPVIGVLGQGVSDLIINMKNGILVKPKNIDDIVNALDYLLKDTNASREMGLYGMNLVRNGWTWEHNANKTIEVYKHIK